MNRTAVQERQQATGSGQPPGAPAAPCRLPAAEPDDPRNGLLDAFEQFVEALDANDLRTPMVARIKRMFPEIVPPPAAPVKADPEAPAAVTAALAAAGPLGLDALIRELRRLEKLKMNALAHQAVQAVKTAAEAALPLALSTRENTDA